MGSIGHLPTLNTSHRSRKVRSTFSTAIATASAACLLLSQAPLHAQSFRPFPVPVSGDLPYDVDVNKVRELDKQGKVIEAQREFDILSWQAFLALNWPADAHGQPQQPNDPKKVADTKGPRVWNFWRSSSSIFLPDGATPSPWTESAASSQDPNAYTVKAAWRQHTTSADQNFQAFAGPLVDQNGKWARYESLVNHEEFDYIVQNELYSQDGQVAFSQRPADNQVDFPINDGHKKHGAIEIKLAWKELGNGDDPTRFYTTKIKARISEPAKPGQTEPETREFEAGLVGMHITMHTESSPEWIWATFEQIDNVRVNKDAHGNPTHPNFFNPNVPQPVNILPGKNAVIDPKTGFPVVVTDPNVTPTTWIESLTTAPVQLARIDVPTQGQLNPLDAKIADQAADLNKQVQAELAKLNSVFQYYELIGTQWPVNPNAPAFAGGEGSAPESITHKTPGNMVPVFLVNTTMETYFMKGKQPAGPLEQDDRLAPNAPPIDSTIVIGTESCVGCHYSSGICIGFKTNDDGSYKIDPDTGKRIPIFGENCHFGKTGNASFSWLFQIESQSKPYTPPANSTAATQATSPKKAKAVKNPAKMLDIKKYIDGAADSEGKLKPHHVKSETEQQ
jgi:hypothetical protein